MATTTMRIVDETGHRTLTFPDTPDGIAAAVAVFEQQLADGFRPFGGSSMHEPLDQIDRYDPTIPVICWVRPLVGG